jgi:hypothetical protein
LNQNVKEAEIDLLRINERTGRPLGLDSFIEKMEQLLNRKLRNVAKNKSTILLVLESPFYVASMCTDNKYAPIDAP